MVQPISTNRFDVLAQKLLNVLYSVQDVMKIKLIIESELCVTYGLYKTEFDSDKLTEEIINWWNEQ